MLLSLSAIPRTRGAASASGLRRGAPDGTDSNRRHGAAPACAPVNPPSDRPAAARRARSSLAGSTRRRSVCTRSICQHPCTHRRVARAHRCTRFAVHGLLRAPVGFTPLARVCVAHRGGAYASLHRTHAACTLLTTRARAGRSSSRQRVLLVVYCIDNRVRSSYVGGSHSRPARSLVPRCRRKGPC